MSHLLFGFLQKLEKSGLKLRTVYDIGACVGDWSRDVKTHALPFSDYVLFEANRDYKEDLKQSGFRHYMICLSNPGRGQVDFYNGKNSGDSYYKETTSNYDNQSSIRVYPWTLDALALDEEIPPPDFIKLDTQGSELDILMGGEKALAHASVVHMECPIIQYNRGAPTIQDKIDFMLRRKFIPIRIWDIHVWEQTLLSLDMMFMREDVKARYLEPNSYVRPYSGLPDNPPVALSA